MALEIDTMSSVRDFITTILPEAYQAGLHRIPAKYGADHPLLLHGTNVLLIGDLLIEYLSKQHPTVKGYFDDHRAEIWLTLFLHDILKEKRRVDQLDITPDDIEEWCQRLEVSIDRRTTMQISARVATHERYGYPVQGGLLRIAEDDLAQLVVRMADRLGSMRDINEHRLKKGWGLPGMQPLFEGWIDHRGRRYKGLNERMQEFTNNNVKYQLIAHTHVRTQHAFLTSLLLSTTAEVLQAQSYGLWPLNIFYNGVVYIGTAEQCQFAQQPETPKAVAERVLEKVWGKSDGQDTSDGWPLLHQIITERPMNPASISVRTTKISSPLRLLGTPLLGGSGFLEAVREYVEKRTSSRQLAGMKTVQMRATQIQSIFNRAIDILRDMKKNYSLALYSEVVKSRKRMPLLQTETGEEITLQTIVKETLDSFNVAAMIRAAAKAPDVAGINAELKLFFDAFADACADLDWDGYLEAMWAKYREVYRPVTEMLVNEGIFIGETPMTCEISANIEETNQFCPSCGGNFVKVNNRLLRTDQRETAVPTKVKSHTNSATGAKGEGTRFYCYTCFMELSLRGLNFQPEAFENKQPFLYLHLLPNFSFPMNWMDALQVQFGFQRGDLRLQIQEATIRTLFESLFSDDCTRDWRWIRVLADPMRVMKEAFFADNTYNRDEFFTLPPIQVPNAVLLPYYARPNEQKSEGGGMEDTVGRKELWLRGLTWATILTQTLPVRIVISESPLLNIDPQQVSRSLTVVGAPGIIGRLLSRVQDVSGEAETAVRLTALPDLLRLLVFALRMNRVLGGVRRGKDGREYYNRPSRRVVELLNDLATDDLVGATYHQRDAQSREVYWTEEYLQLTQACLEVDKMLNETEVNRIQKLVDVTQRFYSPYPWDSSHTLTLPFKVVTKSLQKLAGTRITLPEIKTIIRSDLESAVRRQAGGDSTAWIILRDKSIPYPEREHSLTTDAAEFVDVFFQDVVKGICGDMDSFLTLRKRLQSGYLILMKDAGYTRWQAKKATQAIASKAEETQAQSLKIYKE
jgi:hypothetical protein